MARLIWMLLMACLVAALVMGTSWVAAYATVNDMLGAPPPEMGHQKTQFLWGGIPTVRGHPRAWSFSYGPTRIPNTPSVRIYVGPTGKVLRTEPEDLKSRIDAFHLKGF